MLLGIILVTFERSVQFVIFVTPLSRKRGFRGLEGPVVPNFRSFFRGGAPDDDLRPFVVLFQPTGSPWGSVFGGRSGRFFTCAGGMGVATGS